MYRLVTCVVLALSCAVFTLVQNSEALKPDAPLVVAEPQKFTPFNTYLRLTNASVSAASKSTETVLPTDVRAVMAMALAVPPAPSEVVDGDVWNGPPANVVVQSTPPAAGPFVEPPSTDREATAPLESKPAKNLSAEVSEHLKTPTVAHSAPAVQISDMQSPDLRVLNGSLGRSPEAEHKFRSKSLARMELDAPILAPMAHARFCLKYPADCRADDKDSGPMELTEQRRAELLHVNTDVNRAIHPMRMNETVAEEKWLISPKFGDCNDYAVTKRHRLLALGWPAHNLLLAEVVTTWGEHHLVLVARTSEGDLVADNLNTQVQNWARTSYQWVRIESPVNPAYWSTIKVPRPGLVAMVESDHQR